MPQTAPYEAILFDLDGVIIDTEAEVTAFWEALAAQNGITLTRQDYVRHVYGCSAKHTFKILFPALSQADQQAALDHMLATETTQQYTAVDGIVALLEALQAAGIPTALVTSGADFKLNAVMDQLGIRHLFSTMITADQITHSKPHPEGYLLAASRLGKSPERCIVFEDALSGVEAAVNAGALCVGVQASDVGVMLREAGALTVIRSFGGVALHPNGTEAVLTLSDTEHLTLQSGG
jgi:HAD superfamily hydrolase (TIGR01509 family)